MPNLSIQVPREVCQLHRCTDRESSRFSLGGVLVEIDATKHQAIAVATDGRSMAVARWECQSVAIEPVIVPAGLLEAMAPGEMEPGECDKCGTWHDRKNHARLRLEIDAKNVTLSEDAAADVRTSANAELIDGRFPTWRDAAKERPADEEARVYIAPRRLIELLKIAQALVTDDEQVAIELRIPNKEGDPLHVVGSRNGKEFFGILMPVARDA